MSSDGDVKIYRNVVVVVVVVIVFPKKTKSKWISYPKIQKEEEVGEKKTAI